jgi:hypothetical protein
MITLITIARSTQKSQANTIRRGTDVLSHLQQAEAEEMMRRADPAFDPIAFYRRAQAAFLKIQDGWCSHNLQLIRPFISDAVHERFAIQIREQQALGYRDRMQNIAIESVGLAQAKCGNVFDAVTVRIAASAADFRVTLDGSRRVSGSTQSEPFVEFWTFLRRRGVKTIPGKPGLIEGNCPNCGAAIEMNQNAKCDHCAALLRSGQFDWVLCEITQESEWRPRASDDVPGMNAILQRDSQLSVELLEDRASVLFWRWCEAHRTGTSAPLRKVALADFCNAFDVTVRSRQSERRWYGECAVGSVDVVGILAGEPMDRVLVRVRWSGWRFTDSGNGPQRGEQTAVFSNLLVLGRNSGAQTNVDAAISSAHCPSCGGPQTDDANNACTFCGVMLNDPAREWLLLDTPSSLSLAAETLLAQARSGEDSAVRPSAIPSSAGLLEWVIGVAIADSEIHSREMDVIREVGLRRRIPEHRLDTMLHAAVSGKLQAPWPRHQTEAQEWLRVMAMTAWQDGKLAPAEMAVMRTVGSRVGLSDADVQLLIRQARADVYAKARAALRDEAIRGNGNKDSHGI